MATIETTPAAGQKLTHEDKHYNTIKEGLAYILVPDATPLVPQTTPKGENQAQSVFYNPIQQFNRDLSVLAIKAYSEDVAEKKQALASKKRKNQAARQKSNKRKSDEISKDDATKEKETTSASTTTSALPVETSNNAMEGVETAKPIPVNETNGAVPENTENGSAAQSESVANEPQSKDAPIDSGTIMSPANRDAGPPANHKPSPFTILDALSATGLRALRYAQEIPATTSVTANDLLKTATESIKLNVKHNKLEGKIKSVTGNALSHMYGVAIDQVDDMGRPRSSKKYDVIDLDPYGTAAPFLDAAVQAVRDGGLLCVTCTDAGVWASNGYPEKAFSLYGGTPAKGEHSHESGLRLILHAIATSAARYGLAIEPLLSLSIDFYARVFVRVKKSPAQVKFLAGKTMTVANCDSGCGAWTTQLVAKNRVAPNKSGNGNFWKHVFATTTINDTCEHCGYKTHLAGPMYAGPLHTPSFVKRILDMLPNVDKTTYQTTARIEGMLSMALEETLLPLEPERGLESPTAVVEGEVDPAAVDLYPFFFIPSVLAKVIHCVTPHENALRGALRSLGYRVTRSHTKGGSIKTDAPWSIIWEVMRQWQAQKAPVRVGAIRENSAGWKIMGYDKQQNGKSRRSTSPAPGSPQRTVASPSELVFDENLEKLGKEIGTKKIVRYQANPRENWGPMARATGH